MYTDLVLRVTYDNVITEIPVRSDIPLRLDISAVENQDIGQFYSVGSQTFDLPGNKFLNQFFQHAYDPSATNVPGFYNSIPCKLLLQGETLIDGQLQLLEVTTDEDGYVLYKVQVTDSVVELKDILSGKLIKDADFGDYTHELTADFISGSWLLNEFDGQYDPPLNGAIFYPMVDYGTDENVPFPFQPKIMTGKPGDSGSIFEPGTPMGLQQFLPSIRVPELINVIFSQAGFSYTSSFVDNKCQNMYVLPKAQENLGPIASFTGIEVDMSTNQIITLLEPGGTVTETIEFDTEVSDPQNEFNPITHTYTAPIDGWYFVDIFLSLSVDVPQADPCDVRLSFGGISKTRSLVYTDNTATVELKRYIYLQGGQTYQPTLRLQAINPNASFEVTVLSSESYFSIPIPADAYNGATVDMADQWDDKTKTIDVLKGFITQFNLVVYPEPGQTRVMRVETFDDWIRQGSIVDWTFKYNTAQRININHTVDEQPKELLFASSDDSDRLSKVFIESVPNYQYGTVRSLATSNVTQGNKEVKSYFAPLVLAPMITGSKLLDEQENPTDVFTNLFGNGDSILPHLYKFDNNEQKAYKFKPRIGYKVGPIEATNDDGEPLNFFIQTGTPTGYSWYSTLSNVEMPNTLWTNTYDAVNSGSTNDFVNASLGTAVGVGSRDINFDSSYQKFIPDFYFTSASVASTGSGAFNTYWETYIESLYWDSAIKLTMDVEFAAEEYKDIRLNDRIFIKNQLYRINKIEGFNVNEDDVVTVELIKLYPKYYGQGTFIPPFTTTTTSTSTTTTSTTAGPTTTTTTSTTISGSTTTTTTSTTSTSTSTSTTTTSTTAAPDQQWGDFYVSNTDYTSEIQACGATNLGTRLFYTASIGYTFAELISHIQGGNPTDVYTNSTLTTPFGGIGNFYGSDGVGPNASYAMRIATGTADFVYNCGLTTTTTTSTQAYQNVLLYEQSGGGGWNSFADACDGVGGTSIVALYAPIGQPIEPFTNLYTNPDLTIPFDGNSKWFQKQGTTEVIFVDSSGEITQLVDCAVTTTTSTSTSTTTLPPVTQIYSPTVPGSGNQDSCGCELETTQFNYQVLGTNVDITQDMTGETIYEDWDTSTLFVGDDQWYCIATSNGVTPQYSIRINNLGIVTDWAASNPCPTTTTTTSTTLNPNGCYEWELNCSLGNPSGCQVDYTDCSGNAQSTTVPEDSTGIICARPTPSINGGSVALLGVCTTTTTSTSTSTTTTTAAPLNEIWVSSTRSSGFNDSTTACTIGNTGQAVYTERINVAAVQIGDTLYADSAGTIPWDSTDPIGATLWWGFGDNLGQPTTYALQIAPGGQVVDKVLCAPPTTTSTTSTTAVPTTTTSTSTSTSTTVAPTTTTTTSTTLNPTGCFEWEMSCPLGNPGGCFVQYTDCDGNPQSFTQQEDTDGIICGRPTPTISGGTVTFVGTCVTTTTTTSTTAAIVWNNIAAGYDAIDATRSCRAVQFSQGPFSSVYWIGAGVAFGDADVLYGLPDGFSQVPNGFYSDGSNYVFASAEQGPPGSPVISRGTCPPAPTTTSTTTAAPTTTSTTTTSTTVAPTTTSTSTSTTTTTAPPPTTTSTTSTTAVPTTTTSTTSTSTSTTTTTTLAPNCQEYTLICPSTTPDVCQFSVPCCDGSNNNEILQPGEEVPVCTRSAPSRIGLYGTTDGPFGSCVTSC